MEKPELSRLKKLKALAERGIGGEKENSQMLLEKLCDKYGISVDEVESSDERKMHWFHFSRRKSHASKLLQQCIFKTLGKDFTLYTRGGKKGEIGVSCSTSEAMEIELDFDFFSVALEAEIERMLHAFIQMNNIFPPNVEVSDRENELSEEDVHLYCSIKKQSRVLQINGSGKPELRK